MIKAKVTHKGSSSNGDVISIFDADGREIAIRRHQIKLLRSLLKGIGKKETELVF